MVDPRVFENVGVDPERWSGFAFGCGVERVAQLRHDITDIRALWEGDLRVRAPLMRVPVSWLRRLRRCGGSARRAGRPPFRLGRGGRGDRAPRRSGRRRQPRAPPGRQVLEAPLPERRPAPAVRGRRRRSRRARSSAGRGTSVLARRSPSRSWQCWPTASSSSGGRCAVRSRRDDPRRGRGRSASRPPA